MIEVAPTVLVFLLAIILMTSQMHRFRKQEQPYVWAGFFGHVVAAFAQIWITRYYYGHGDMLMYYDQANILLRYLSDYSSRPFGVLFELILQRELFLPFDLRGVGSSTGSMVGLTTVTTYLLGRSLYATTLFMSLTAFSGQLAIYLAARAIFARRFTKVLLFSSLLVPSAVFWSSGILKETVAVAGLGWVFWGMSRIVNQKDWAVGGGVMLLAAIPVSLVKSYILFPLGIAFGVWLYWQRASQSRGKLRVITKPIYLVFGLGLALAAIIGLGELFPRFALDNLGGEISKMQSYAGKATAGSNYVIGDPAARSLTGQIAFLPLGIFTAMFRPVFFEAHNIVAFVNSLETTAIALTFIVVIRRLGLRGIWREISSSPAAMFCMVFVVLFSAAVGLSTTNLGTLSRYRIPMMPFYCILLFLLFATTRERHSQKRQTT